MVNYISEVYLVMAMFPNKIRLVILILFLLLICVFPAWGATYFASTDGSGTICSQSNPCRLDYAVESKATFGDTVNINDGTYTIGQLVVPAGVSLVSTSQDYTKVKLQPNTSMSTSNPFILLSSAAGSNGNQTISYIEVDGINGSNIARIGIGVQSRNNVRIHHCYIHDFYGTNNAATVEVKSLQVSPTSSWWTYWPADPQADGTDTNINALWPSNPVENFELDNNEIDDGGYYNGTTTSHGSVALWHLKNSSIHDNIFNNTTSRGQAITGRGGKTALLWNVDIYNNTFTMGAKYTTRTNFAIEIWVMRGGCEIYNNQGTWFYSITVGKDTSIHDNSLTISPEETSRSIGIEFNLQSYGSIYKNYVVNAVRGTSVGLGSEHQDKNYICENTKVYNNTFVSPFYNAIYIKSFGGLKLANTNTTRYIDAYNNILVGPGSYGIGIQQQNNTGTGVLDHVNIDGNIITDFTGYAGKTIGTVSILTIDNNQFYGNGDNSWSGSTDTNTITTDPGLTDLTAPPPINSTVLAAPQKLVIIK